MDFRRLPIWVGEAVCGGLIAQWAIEYAQELGAFTNETATVQTLIHTPFVAVAACVFGSITIGAKLNALLAKKKLKYRDTRLTVRLDPAGTGLYTESSKANVYWWHARPIEIVKHEVLSGTIKNTTIRFYQLVVIFDEEIPYSQPILNSFGHKMPEWDLSPVGTRGSVIQFHQSLNAPQFEIWFPPDDHYEKPN